MQVPSCIATTVWSTRLTRQRQRPQRGGGGGDANGQQQCWAWCIGCNGTLGTVISHLSEALGKLSPLPNRDDDRTWRLPRPQLSARRASLIASQTI